jgi:hypothetical protein
MIQKNQPRDETKENGIIAPWKERKKENKIKKNILTTKKQAQLTDAVKRAA